ncbi:hypothetical protein E3N88_42963 [Mikania micrantha]|uniref:Uncharacterized protein n=1 Tax=Mikania micrantha TaxID=192012 RepID=A0A5N6LGF7_9ASTR|nr:hypothetical protein E3N88_42963 [Mikania micrantha]
MILPNPSNISDFHVGDFIGPFEATNIWGQFMSKSACKFEFKWKSLSRKMTRKTKSKDDGGLHLLQHRNAALQKVKDGRRRKSSESLVGDSRRSNSLEIGDCKSQGVRTPEMQVIGELWGVTCKDAFARRGEMRKRQKM